MTNDVVSHYSYGGLKERISNGIDKAGQPVTVQMLGMVDEFHVGGRPATSRLIDPLGLSADDHVLDIGSGLGGTARYIASTTGARVTGIDLTAEYVEVAQWLTQLVELDDLVSFVHGSAAALPADSAPFTAATMVHVGMNIADKQSIFDQVAATLLPAGRFAIYDIMATGAGSHEFPMPWAAGPETSAVEALAAYRDYLFTAGFEIESISDRTDVSLAAMQQLSAAAADGPAPLGLHLVMGPTTPTKMANLLAALRHGVLAPTEIVARLP